MKVNVSMYGDEKQQASDQEVFRAKDFAIQTITTWMRWIFVSKVKLDRTRSIGTAVLTQLTWDGEKKNLPALAAHMRPYILWNMIKMLMENFGIFSIDLALTEDETKERNDYWEHIVTGKGDAQVATVTEAVRIPLNLERDPVAEPIVVEAIGP